MEAIKTEERKTQHSHTEERKLYSVEEVLNKVDNKFINFYGEYGRKIVNDRRAEWNEEGVVSLEML
jgi:hypothetical protein